jgi:hypothetical protein
VHKSRQLTAHQLDFSTVKTKTKTKTKRRRRPTIRMMVVTDSTNIAAVGYAPKRQQLRVRFRDGSEYAYKKISQDAYTALVSAESIGEHFAKHIRRLPSERLRRPRARAHAS